MPVTRAAANGNTSTAKKAYRTSKGAPKPSRERKAKVTKKASPKKANKGENDKNTRPHLSIGSKVPLCDNFGGELYLHDGTETSLKQLVDKSRNGVIVYVFPKRWDGDAYDMYSEFNHAQLDWEPAEMDTIGISPDSVPSTAAFVKEKDISLPLASNPSASLIKAMSITSSKGKMTQGAFIISKTGLLLARTMGKQDKIMDDLDKIIFTLIEGKRQEIA
ncbi:uncharacterized protein TrAFT101_010779 [Trichoderma asperellum]|uniref:Alkyl hydroperoxide reductase subunit C/ Thiol specific antioxidant domain-containing protein n=1 Tax=Trichoderma asperellum (strain ATCC 204424 / CBS 433.97 / NBRC 101777) TaxID=1042311 RepID=A0A2T3YWZ4_TRIA4|nr:hypothetical protein M441DRAFT_83006 [Trichoderma asperellum CBS 433.97]PTB37044.1 hypothetical protein M441DRAFT_83006 [Trichoderma asperellum CBS 433.97]UKZ95973.1 hypothetical protein TrAFT101_010779 [Trichoderma asperellum]